MVYGQTVELRADPTQDDTDRYGRLLRHVYIDGQGAVAIAYDTEYAMVDRDDDLKIGIRTSAITFSNPGSYTSTSSS